MHWLLPQALAKHLGGAAGLGFLNPSFFKQNDISYFILFITISSKDRYIAVLAIIENDPAVTKPLANPEFSPSSSP